jgi:hypothetical protein
MNRKMFLSVPLLLISTIILSAIGVALWAIFVIPAMIFPYALNRVRPPAKINERIMKIVVQSAMKGIHK